MYHDPGNFSATETVNVTGGVGAGRRSCTLSGTAATAAANALFFSSASCRNAATVSGGGVCGRGGSSMAATIAGAGDIDGDVGVGDGDLDG